MAPSTRCSPAAKPSESAIARYADDPVAQENESPEGGLVQPVQADPPDPGGDPRPLAEPRDAADQSDTAAAPATDVDLEAPFVVDAPHHVRPPVRRDPLHHRQVQRVGRDRSTHHCPRVGGRQRDIVGSPHVGEAADRPGQRRHERAQDPHLSGRPSRSRLGRGCGKCGTRSSAPGDRRGALHGPADRARPARRDAVRADGRRSGGAPPLSARDASGPGPIASGESQSPRVPGSSGSSPPGT